MVPVRGPRTSLALLVVVGVACSGPSASRSAGPMPERPEPIVAAVAAPSVAGAEFDVRGLVAQTVRPRFLVYEHPDADARLSYSLWSDNPWGQPLSYQVVDTRTRAGERWFEVRLPIRPNGSTGWVRSDDVRTHRVHQRIVVDLSAHVLRRFIGGTLTDRIEVAIGTSSTPTPPGHFFVWARVSYRDPTGPYGVFALGLSGFSRVLTAWPGGGRLAIHGTDDPGDIGRDVSHGCVRVFNRDLHALRDVPLGTPVIIRR
jgi:lipoprotein-anchoring transpeptidase ErfK/SrfK